VDREFGETSKSPHTDFILPEKFTHMILFPSSKTRPIIARMDEPQKDPALSALIDQIENGPPLLLQGLNLEMSPELTRLLERGLIGDSLPPVLKDSKAAKAFQQAFEMIGGVPRLALWADQNPTKFYTLYSKLVPATAELQTKTDITVTIKWATPDRLSYRNDVVDETIAVPLIENKPDA
jgi:hypothetical protein